MCTYDGADAVRCTLGQSMIGIVEAYGDVQEQGVLGHIGLVECSRRHCAALERVDAGGVELNGARRRKEGERVGRRTG